MLFRPNFCANCGEKIERLNWGPFTSRRFCQVCESEFKGQDLLTRFIVAGGVLSAIFGLGSYLNSRSVPANALVARQARLLEAPAVKNDTRPAGVPEMEPPRPAESPQPGTTLTQRTQTRRAEAHEAIYFCGAETRKGTPCARRVKGNTRCFQHTGMPAMAQASKLKVK